MESQQKRKRRSFSIDSKKSDSLNLVVTSENKFLNDGGNAQSNRTMWQVVSSRLIDLSKNATDDQNNDVQNKK